MCPLQRHTGINEAATEDDGDDQGEHHAHEVVGGVAPVLPTKHAGEGGRARRATKVVNGISASVFHATSQ